MPQKAIFAQLSKRVFTSKERNDSVAQLVEHYTFNVVVLGSNPSGITKGAQKAPFVLNTCSKAVLRDQAELLGAGRIFKHRFLRV